MNARVLPHVPSCRARHPRLCLPAAAGAMLLAEHGAPRRAPSCGLATRRVVGRSSAPSSTHRPSLAIPSAVPRRTVFGGPINRYYLLLSIRHSAPEPRWAATASLGRQSRPTSLISMGDSSTRQHVTVARSKQIARYSQSSSSSKPPEASDKPADVSTSPTSPKLYLWQLTSTRDDDLQVTEEHYADMGSRVTWMQHMTKLFRTEEWYGVRRTNSSYARFFDELLADAADSVNPKLRTAAIYFTSWISSSPRVISLVDAAQNMQDPFLLAETLYLIANTFESLPVDQRQEAARRAAELCRTLAQRDADSIGVLWHVQMRPVARLVDLLSAPSSTLRPYLQATADPWLTSMEEQRDPVVSAYVRAAREQLSGTGDGKLPFWVDSNVGKYGVQAAAAAVASLAIGPLWAFWNTRFYTDQKMRFKWVNHAGLRALPASLAAIPLYYLARTFNHDVVQPNIEPRWYPHSAVGFGAVSLLFTTALVRAAGPYFILPTLLGLSARGLSSRHSPNWVRPTSWLADELDSFFKEFPLPYYLGLEEKTPFNPVADLYWRGLPDPETAKQSKVRMLIKDMKDKLQL